VETSDPPDHTRQRQYLEAAMTQSLRRNLEGIAEDAASRLLRDHLGSGTLEVVAQFASPMTDAVLQRVLGLGEEETRALSVALRELLADFRTTPAEGPYQHRSASLTAAQAVLQDRWHDEESLAHRLLSVVVARGLASREEAINNLLLVFAAGHGTTTSLISGAIRQLVIDPGQFLTVQRDPRLASKAIEETLRLESPIQSVGRVARARITLGGRTIRPGEEVILLLGSANRDDQVFRAADTFDIRRHPNRHVAFGRGRHTCLGAALARLQGRVAIRTFTTMVKSPVLREGPTWSQIANVRGITSMTVTFEQGERIQR
jgi:cytochrome P450